MSKYFESQNENIIYTKISKYFDKNFDHGRSDFFGCDYFLIIYINHPSQFNVGYHWLEVLLPFFWVDLGKIGWVICDWFKYNLVFRKVSVKINPVLGTNN